MNSRRLSNRGPLASILAALIALGPVAAPSTAWAQDDVAVAQARARFKEGVEFYDKGQFELARASFLQAYALKKHPDVLLNLAWSSLKSGHPVEAEREFNQFLKEGQNIPTAKRADAEKGLGESRAKIGRIEVAATSGTDVAVDDNHVGTAPLSDPVSVEPGAHTVKFKGPDGTTDSQSVSVLAGQTVTAKFGAKSSPSTATPPPPPVAADTTPAPASPDNAAAGAHPDQPAQTASPEVEKKGILSPPKNIVPVVIGGVITLGAIGTAIAMGIVKSSAQDKATNAADQIHQHGGTQGTCVNPPQSSIFYGPCQALNDDNNAVNNDALVGNIMIGVGAVALLGTALYWILAPKQDDSSAPSSGTTTSSMRPVLAPIVGPHVSGLSLSATF